MTLYTLSGAVLAIGSGASGTQISGASIDTWGLWAEGDMERASDGKGLVTNYASIPAPYKQWLEAICNNRIAFYGINENPNSWTLATAQSKLNVIDTTWQDFLKDIKDKDVIDNMGL